MGHSPEPWEHQGSVVKAKGETIVKGMVRLNYFKDAPHYNELLEQDKVNARRIVACVNACVGIPTETLEVMPTLHAEHREGS